MDNEMNYEDMTDEEINEAVTKSIGDKVASAFGAILIRDLGINNYCNDWAYGGLIIQNANISINAKSNFDYEIGMCKFTGEWSACAFSSCDGEFGMSDDIIECTNENPLRAAMIVYLMMQEQK